MLYSLLTRSVLDISVLHDRNPLFVTLADGAIRNGYTVRLLNKLADTRTVQLAVDGLPGAEVHVVGPEAAAAGRPLIPVGPDQSREVRVLVTAPSDAPLARSTALVFRAADLAGGRAAVAQDHFIAR